MLAKAHPMIDNRSADRTVSVINAQFGDWHFSLARRQFGSDELAGLYDDAAEDWDDTLARLKVERAYRTVHQVEAPRRPTVQATRKVLDCGVGTGAFSSALIKSIPGTVHLHGIDLSPDMVERARDHFNDLGVDADLRVGDAQDLPFEDRSFDLVMSAHMLEHMARPDEALSEMVRVLRPGGQLLICVTRKSLLGRKIQLKWRTHLVTPDQATGWLENLGLSDVHVLPIKNRPVFNRMSLVCVGHKPL